MKIKQTCEDFRVDELYDLEKFESKKPEGKKLKFQYFILTKEGYTVDRAIEKVAKGFKTDRKNVHFAGTKDRQGLTTQVISVMGLREGFQNLMRGFNKLNRLHLKYIGEFPARLNLGDNLGNKFEIVVRDLKEKDLENLPEKIEKIRERGVPNYFDSQRMGFQNSNPIIGKHLIKGEFKEAFFKILTAIPEDANPEYEKFVNYLKKNWDKVTKENNWTLALHYLPRWAKEQREMIINLEKYKNNYLGAINLIPKKIRTIYVNSYQSYLFNECLRILDSEGELEKYEKLPLVAAKSELKDDWGEIVANILKQDKVKLSDFEMKGSPTIAPKEIGRKTFVSVNNLEVSEAKNDEMNNNRKKITVSFDLDKGAYATNVIKNLFE